MQKIPQKGWHLIVAFDKTTKSGLHRESYLMVEIPVLCAHLLHTHTQRLQRSSHLDVRQQIMEPASIFTLIVTVGALAKSISQRLTDARNIDRQLQEFADDLRALQRVIAEVSALLHQPLIEQTLDQASAGGIVAVIKDDFEVCQSFIEEDLSRMKDESSSMRSRIKRYAGAKKASSSSAELKKRLRDHIMRAQIGLQILNLCVYMERVFTHSC